MVKQIEVAVVKILNSYYSAFRGVVKSYLQFYSHAFAESASRTYFIDKKVESYRIFFHVFHFELMRNGMKQKFILLKIVSVSKTKRNCVRRQEIELFFRYSENECSLFAEKGVCIRYSQNKLYKNYIFLNEICIERGK